MVSKREDIKLALMARSEDVGVWSDRVFNRKIAAKLAFVEQSAPGMTTWENIQYKGKGYVKVSATEESRGMIGEDVDEIAIYYAPRPTSLIITLDEDVLLLLFVELSPITMLLVALLLTVIFLPIAITELGVLLILYPIRVAEPVFVIELPNKVL